MKINLKKINEKFEVVQETNKNNLKEIFGDVVSDKNQINNEEVSLVENPETNSDATKPIESNPSKTIKSDSNVRVNKDEIAMNKQFAEQLSI